MRFFPFLIVLAMSCPAFGQENFWSTLGGKLVYLNVPSSFTHETPMGIDSSIETFASDDVAIAIDSEEPKIDPLIRKQVSVTIDAWTRRPSEKWADSEYVYVDGELAGSIHSIADNSKAAPERPMYLFFGFADAERSISIHVYFKSVSDLPLIRQILPSISLVEVKRDAAVSP
jgi:hypothetical protein